MCRCHVVNIDPKPLTKPNFFLRVLCSLYVYGYSMRVLMPSLGRDVFSTPPLTNVFSLCIWVQHAGIDAESRTGCVLYAPSY